MWQNVANLILRNRFFILLILGMLTAFFGYFAFTSLTIDNKFGNMLPKDSPAQRNYLQFKKQFGEDGNTLVIAIQDKDLYTEEHFRLWKQIGDSILQMEDVESVTSEATLFTLKNKPEESRFEARPVFSDLTFKDKKIDQIKDEVRNSPIFQYFLFNKESNVSLMMIRINEQTLAHQKKNKIVVRIEDLASRHTKTFGKIHFAGLPHIRVITGIKVMKEMYLFIGAAMLFTSILLYMFFRSLRVVMICQLVVVIAVIWSMGLIGLLGFKLSILMALIPPLMIVIGIPNCIFLVTKFHQEFAYHGNKVKALTRVIQKIGTATFMTNLTTALGFLTFVFTNSEKLVQFGIVASIQVMIVFVLSICIIPICFSLSRPPKTRHIKHLSRNFAVGLIETLIHWTTSKRPYVYIITICLVIISLIGISQIKATGNLTGDLPPNDPILKDIQFIEKNFGGSIPFEIMVNYKEKGRLLKKSTLSSIEEIQNHFAEDTLFSRSISIVDLIKVINMAYYNNDPERYTLIARNDQLRLKKYVDNVNKGTLEGGGFKLQDLVDTAHTTLRIRMQIHDLGSYEVADKAKLVSREIDSLLNPDKKEIEKLFKKTKKNTAVYQELFSTYPQVYNSTTAILAKGNPDLQYKFDVDSDLIREYFSTKNFHETVRKAIDHDYFDVTLTGTSIIASEGTQYLIFNLITSLMFAVLLIGILMAIIFRSWRMVFVSLIPNLVPLLATAAIMGYLQIPIKPSTILVFSIAFGISVDDTIHFLAKYQQALKQQNYNIKKCVTDALRESGLGMFYTSIVLFSGFITFTLSDFGGTKSLGLLISLTLLIAMVTNLVLLPSLLLTLEKRLTSKAFREPYFEVYDEETDIDFGQLIVQDIKDLDRENLKEKNVGLNQDQSDKKPIDKNATDEPLID